MAGGGTRTRLAARQAHTGFLDIEIDTETAMRGIEDWMRRGGAWDMRKWDKVSQLTGANAKQHLENATSTWLHKPAFDVKIQSGMDVQIKRTTVGGATVTNAPQQTFAGSVAIDINANPETPFVYVDKGTKPHAIRPKGPWPLVFRWGGPGSYRAKTQPGSLQARTGGASGPIVAFRGVWHPGSQPRHIIEQVIAKIGEAWPRIVDQVFGR